MSSETDQHILDLAGFFNCDGISTSANTADGGLNVWRNTLPAEDLPAGGELVTVHGVQFRFPPTADGALNNLICAGQFITVPVARYDWIYVLAGGERRSEDPVQLHFADGHVDPEWLRVSDFWPGPSRFGEPAAFECGVLHYPRHVQRHMRPTIWFQRVPVTRMVELRAIRLPENRSMHIFAMTLLAAVAPADATPALAA